MLGHPYILRGPQRQAQGAKSEVGPNKGEQNQKWLPTPCLLGGPKEGGNATSPLHSPGSPTPSTGSKIRSGPQQRGTKSEVAASPCLLGGPKEGRNATSPLHSKPNAKHSDQNRNWLPHPYLLGALGEGGNAAAPQHSRGSPTPNAGTKIRSGPQKRGTKSELATSPLPSRGPKRGRKCYVNPAFSGVPNKGEQNQKRMPHPCLLGGPKEGGNATSPLHSRGSPTPSAGSKIRSGYLAPIFSGVPRQGDKIKSGFIVPPFLEFPIVGRHEQETKRCLFSEQEWCLSIEPFSHPPDLGCSIDPPLHLQARHAPCAQTQAVTSK